MRATIDATKSVQFDHLDISIELLYRAGETVGITVSDPHDLIGRSFDADDWAAVLHDDLPETELSDRRHTICNRLHVANLAIEILTRQAELEDKSQVGDFAKMAIEALSELEEIATNKQ